MMRLWEAAGRPRWEDRRFEGTSPDNMFAGEARKGDKTPCRELSMHGATLDDAHQTGILEAIRKNLFGNGASTEKAIPTAGSEHGREVQEGPIYIDSSSTPEEEDCRNMLNRAGPSGITFSNQQQSTSGAVGEGTPVKAEKKSCGTQTIAEASLGDVSIFANLEAIKKSCLETMRKFNERQCTIEKKNRQHQRNIANLKRRLLSLEKELRRLRDDLKKKQWRRMRVQDIRRSPPWFYGELEGGLPLGQFFF
ncbi:uncharacterized protein LOC129335387 [Eublepharis macularius]|uniref:Uncharacterized protein LOC129335387 n=1 Tax=Eublepharis macularius TaxID=481883 RepID=A0AA97JR66_EUBMA|nr:uncharacterized protein LOC129335387 [Eublepharis macularius]